MDAVASFHPGEGVGSLEGLQGAGGQRSLEDLAPVLLGEALQVTARRAGWRTAVVTVVLLVV